MRFPHIALGATAVTALHIPQQKHLTEPVPVIAGEAPLINSERLQDTILADRLFSRAEQLYEIAKEGTEEYGHPTRVIGSKGHLATLEYIKSELNSLGGYYNVTTQDFGAVSGNVYEFRLVIGDRVENATTMSLTPPTTDKEPVVGDLYLVKHSGCKADDYPSKLKGNIAFIKRGECSFGDKSQLAGKAGAVAAVIYNTDPDDLEGTLGSPTPDQIATFGLNGKDGAEYAEQLSRGREYEASAYIDATVDTITTSNIIAQTVHGDPENCVMLGAHSDSVSAGPGINDDGSGSVSLLEVAVQLAKFSVKNCVRFAWWSAEEEGLLGSYAYANSLSEEENRKIRLCEDIDMLASPNYSLEIYNATDDVNPTGSEALRDLYIDWYTSKGLNYTLVPFDGRSDYAGFIDNGIPSGGIATGAEGIKTKEEEEMFGGTAGEWYDKNYHQIGDDLTNLNMVAWEINTKLIAHSVATYASSFKGFPKREKKASSQQETPRWKYRGHKLIM